MPAIRHCVINFLNLAVFKLQTQMSVGLRMTGDGQDARSVFIKAVTNLGIGFEDAGQGKNIHWLNTIFEGGNEWRLVNNYIILVFKEDKVFKFNRVSQSNSKGNPLFVIRNS